ncbi:phospholipid-transporting ATPase ABCA1-like isoform X2 [Oscarella lobularis]|uniref:phospholipid-transporting ATPase ABCA1-like isoform X2 n=1 Tax=Oscarella lobularis TaxID=121494 RepID=UPI00331408C6
MSTTLRKLKLLLWKNYILKKRQPLILGVELVWPILLILVILILRKQHPPNNDGPLYYVPRALPSAGLLPFLRGVACDPLAAYHLRSPPNDGRTDFHSFNPFVDAMLSNLSQFLDADSGKEANGTEFDLLKFVETVEEVIEDEGALNNAWMDYETTGNLGRLGKTVGLLNKEKRIRVERLLKNSSMFSYFLTHQMNFSRAEAQSFLLSSVDFDALQNYFLMRGLELQQCMFSSDSVQLGKCHYQWQQAFAPDDETLFPPTSLAQLRDLLNGKKKLTSVLFTGTFLKGLGCDHEKFSQVFLSLSSLTDTARSFCNMTIDQAKTFTSELQSQLNYSALPEVKMTSISSDSPAERLRRSYDYVERQLPLLAEFYDAVDVSGFPVVDDSANSTVASAYICWLLCGNESKSCQEGVNPSAQDLGRENSIRVLDRLVKGFKILYAPNTSSVNDVIQTANRSFREVDRLKFLTANVLNLTDSLSNSVASLHSLGSFNRSLLCSLLNGNLTSLKSLSDEKGLRKAAAGLKYLLSSPNLNASRDYCNFYERIRQYVSSDDALAKLKRTRNAVAAVQKALESLDLNIWMGFPDEDSLMTYAGQAARNQSTVWAGIVFTNLSTGGRIGKHAVYKIRMNKTLVQEKNFLRNLYWRVGPESHFWMHRYKIFGFVYFQDMIDRAISSLAANFTITAPGVYIQEMPYPCFIHDRFMTAISAVLPLFMALAWIFTVSMIIRSIVHEKEMRLKEMMKIMGLGSVSLWLSWFISNMIIMTVISLLLAMALKFGGVIVFSDFFVIFLYFLNYAFATNCLCCLISTFFNKANLAALCGGMIYLITFLPYIVYIEYNTDYGFSQKAGLSLLSSTAFGGASTYVGRLEEQGIGVHWNNMKQSIIPGDSYNFLIANLFITFDGFLYFFIAWYIDHVFPGQYGVPKPWYFLFLKTYWCGFQKQPQVKKSNFNYASLSGQNDRDEINIPYEEEPSDSPIGVSMRSLFKVFGRRKQKPAIDDLTMNFCEGHVTSFLGPNGAGKTTTLSILTGLFPATSGSVRILGMDVHTSIAEIRKSLGYCPQHNVLFDRLTVAEHLSFYAQMKGMKGKKKVSDEIERWISDLNLSEKKSSRVSNLSGGMKRKLSIALAYIGDSRVVILDEPTAGVDPNARRGIWDLIAKHRKKDRTVIISTHYMDEADVLGDRIAIIARGKLRCYGSSLYLRRNFSCGHLLILIRQPDDSSDCGVITQLIQSYVPSAELVDDRGSELTYVLPTDATRSGSMSLLFSELDSCKRDLGISEYGVSASPLEKVFLKVTEEDEELADESLSTQERARARRAPKDNDVQEDEVDSDTQPFFEGSDGGAGTCTLTGASLYRQQFRALLLRHFHHTRRYGKGVLAQVILPAAFISIALLLRLFALLPQNHTLEMTPSLYPGAYFPFKNFNKGHVAADRLEAILGQPCGLGAHYLALNSSRQELECEIYMSYNSSRKRSLWSLPEGLAPIERCHCHGGRFACPKDAGYPKPPTLSAMDSQVLQNLNAKENLSGYLIETTSQYILHRYEGASFGHENPYAPFPMKASNPYAEVFRGLAVRDAAKAWHNNKGYHALPIALNILNNALLRSHLNSSQNPLEYGITTFNEPLKETVGQVFQDELEFGLDAIIAMCVIFAMAFIPPSYIMILVRERATGAKHLQLVSGVHPALYWLSNFTWNMINYFATVGVLIFIFYAFHEAVYASSSNLAAITILLIFYGWATIPLMYPATFVFADSSTAYVVMMGVNLLVGLATTMGTFALQLTQELNDLNTGSGYLLRKIFLIFPNYCLGRGLLDLSYNYYIEEANGELDGFGLGITLPGTFSFGANGIGRNVLSMALCGAVSFSLVLAIEFKFFKSKKSSRQVLLPNSKDQDDDVVSERRKVAQSSSSSFALTLRDLTKGYRSWTCSSAHRMCWVVRNVCLAVPKGECFGLLGVNGAGKTSIFKMLTGDISITSGEARILNYDVATDVRSVRQHIGYCPQFDAINDLLTGREHLALYSRLKGVSEAEVPEVIRWCLEKMALVEYSDTLAGRYSGGNKRKLSTAIALIGQPQVIFLDEPTTGMDPKAKRFFWSVLQGLVREGRSIVLTSHSMEECEALCTRLAVMVNGEFCCLGSVQHIKSKFGDGYTVLLRVSGRKPNLDPAQQFFEDRYANAELKDMHYNMLEYQLPKADVSLASIFDDLDRHREQLLLEDYSVSQTTMDQIFIRFASQQGSEKKRSFPSVELKVAFDAGQQTVDFIAESSNSELI